MDKWLETYKANYNGQTPEAKELQEFIKTNYKGNSYVPWATMERLIYMQDPEASFYMVAADENGKILHDYVIDVNTYQETQSPKDGHIITKVTNSAHVHFVVVSITFLGKMLVEHYPVQDSAYGAPKVVDQNMVNKALQRAKAKVASRASGLALRLYESKDLQFED